MKKTVAAIAAMVMLLTLFAGCDTGETASKIEDQVLSEEEEAVLQKAYGNEVFLDVTKEAMTAERQEKFPAVTKVFRSEEGNFFICAEPVGYYGPVHITIGIDGKELTIRDLQIVEDLESEEYVRNWRDDWFVSRFRGKNVHQELRSVILEAKAENEIVAVTGATISTDAVILGVNAAFAVIREYELGETAEPVALQAELERRTPETQSVGQ